MEGQACAEMPRYKCHKEVWALKIDGISPANPDGSATLYPKDKRYAPFDVSAEYMGKHRPEVGGYYVVYADGYKSYSPAKAFEDGYAPVSGNPLFRGNRPRFDAPEGDPIEAEIKAKGLTAPRITQFDIDANIASEHYFTAAEGVLGAYKANNDVHVGTAPNKLNATALPLLTFCVLVLENGFTVTGESACASPENFDAEIGRNIARRDAVSKVWPLMGYALKLRLADEQYRRECIARRPIPAHGAPNPPGHRPVA